MKTLLITGASRGLGLEFCRQYAEQGWAVIACCRSLKQANQLDNLVTEYPNIRVCEMDVMNRKKVDDLANDLADVTIDLLICNAGVYGDKRGAGFGNLDYADWTTAFETNVLGAVKVVESFLKNLKSSHQPLIVALSSQMGSIADNSSGGSLMYRSSKASLNAVMKSLSIDLQNEGIGVMIFHPGWVKTDMGGPHALIDAETSVAGMLNQISKFKLSQTGHFIKYDGSLLPW